VIRRVAVPAALVAVVLGLAGCSGARRAPAPGRPLDPVPSVTPGAACLTPAERSGVVRFTSDNGASIAGVVLGTGRTGVVLAHSNNSDMCDWVPYGRVLAAAGYTALSVDLNGFAASQASAGLPADARYDADLSGAVKLLRGRGVHAVFLMGESIGGTAAVKAAADVTPPVAGVIDISSPAELSGVDALAAAPRLTVPLLCIASEHDEFGGDVRKVANAATRAPEHRLEIVAGSGSQGPSLLDPTVEPKAAQVRELVESFLRGHAG
jgi:dienelactone hydrolase